MLQRSGSTVVHQAEHRSCLRVQQLCLIDDMLPFSIEVTEGLAEFTFLRIPRELALERGQVSADRTAVGFTTSDPGTALLAALLLKLSDRADEMDHNQGTIALNAVVQLLSIPRQARPPSARKAGWRSRTAIGFIDSELSDSSLSAERVATMVGISRRRMDNVLTQELGMSTAGLIWYRRLLRAADELRDPRRAAQTITEIAFAAGFEHAAHFTRSFKRQYHCTPSEWRANSKKYGSAPHH
jgi:AraC-like DNA-binding protein